MVRKFSFFLLFAFLLPQTASALTARSGTVASDYVSENTYNNLYPYMNNTMRTNLNPGTTPSQSSAQINVLTRTNSSNASTRNVVPRSAKTSTTNARSAASVTTARAATSSNTSTASARRVTPRQATPANTARSGTTGSTVATARSAAPTSTTKRVVARSGTSTTNATQTAAARGSTRYDGNTSTARQSTYVTYTNTNNTSISSARCMADYAECMNDYCERENTEYNRCYCSAQLAQIDAKYKPEIDSLIKQILTLKNGNYWTDEEMNEYWMDKIGQYTGDNSWTNLEDALNIDWASTESRVRGQQAFATGHEYCVQHLQNCAYMQTNLRDAYRSEIARDCATYESSLQRLKNAAESIVESYK